MAWKAAANWAIQTAPGPRAGLRPRKEPSQRPTALGSRTVDGEARQGLRTSGGAKDLHSAAARRPDLTFGAARPAQHPETPLLPALRDAVQPGPARPVRRPVVRGGGGVTAPGLPEVPAGAACCARPALPAGPWTAARARWWSATPRLAAPRTAAAAPAAAPTGRPPSWTTPAPARGR